MSRLEVPLYTSERIDDLLTHQLQIIQSRQVFSFSLDAVLLARYCSVPSRGRIIDLCTGNGVIPLLLSTRTKVKMDAVELQPRLADMAQRSVSLNQLQQQITIHQGDLKTCHTFLGHGRYDLVTVNPPYLSVNGADLNANEHYAIARHEIACTLEDVIAACSRLVKSGGKVAIVHRPSRLVDLIHTMRTYRLEPKRMRLVYPKHGQEANMVLLEAIRDGGAELRVDRPLIVYNEDNTYCEELMKVYYGNVRESEGSR